MANIVGSKGQVVIEKQLRDRLGVKPGWMAIQRLVDDHIEIYFVPPPHRESLYGAGAVYTDVRLDDVPWHELKEAAWRAAAKERFRRMNESRMR